MLALQKNFTGIDNEEPERIAAYRQQEQQVQSLAPHHVVSFTSSQAKIVLSRRVELLQAVKAKIAKLECDMAFSFFSAVS